MKYIITALALAATPSLADITVDDWRAAPGTAVAAGEVDLKDFKWQARPLIVFSDSRFDPNFIEQMENLELGTKELIDRDILWIYDTDPDTPSQLRKKLRPRGFGVVLIGKDGGIKLRNALPWDMREISRVIDKMPMRQLEIEERRGN